MLTPLLITPQARLAHSTAEKEELRIRGELEAQEARLKQLYQKQGRSQSFATQKDRDVFLKQEVGERLVRLRMGLMLPLTLSPFIAAHPN